MAALADPEPREPKPHPSRSFDADQGVGPPFALYGCYALRRSSSTTVDMAFVDPCQTAVTYRARHCSTLATRFLLLRGQCFGRAAQPSFRRRHVRHVAAIARHASRFAPSRPSPRQLQLSCSPKCLRGQDHHRAVPGAREHSGARVSRQCRADRLHVRPTCRLSC